MKLGIIDVGGGMRDIYGAGVLDRCMEDSKNYVHEFLKLLEAYGGRFRSGQ